MVYVQPGRKGFYSTVIWYLAHCHIAELTNDDILLEEFSEYYCDDIRNGFSNFFEMPVKIDKSKKYGKYDYIFNIENIRTYKDTEICGFIFDMELRRYMKFLIDKYLKINKSIQEKIDSYKQVFESKKVLGVHIRQTDLYTSDKDNKPVKPLDINYYIMEIEKELPNYDMLYIMSDNSVSINRVRNHFVIKTSNGREIFNGFDFFYVEDVLRSGDEKGMPLIREKNNKNKHKLGEDILIETELLSLCDKILITNSNVSSFVLANNPEIKFRYLDLGIDDELLKRYDDVLKNGL